jgi:DNA-binding NtrC family response regulator
MEKPDLAGSKILVVEDEPELCELIAANQTELGAEVTSVSTLRDAKRLAQSRSFEFVFLDVKLPDGLGTELLKERVFRTDTGIIVISGHPEMLGASEAMRLGALDYLIKPFKVDQLPFILDRVRRAKQLARPSDPPGETSHQDFFFGSALAGFENKLHKILAADNRMQNYLPPILIQGETGTGKSTIARWLHYHGPRASQPLVEVNCSALPETLAESELFGHERGAFTDARATRIGLFEAASGGSLLLDELPSLSLPLQAKVLTVIEDRKIRRLGGNKELPVDVRIIAATNCELKQLVANGQFREDLYHRLDLFRLSILPLRERGGDILHLAEKLMDRLCQRYRLSGKEITGAGKLRLLYYKWPGNVRELAHELERAIVFEESDRLNFDYLITVSQAMTPVTHPDWFNQYFVFPPDGFSLEEAIDRIIRHALKQTGNNVSAAAHLLGVSRGYIRYRLEGGKSQ